MKEGKRRNCDDLVVLLIFDNENMLKGRTTNTDKVSEMGNMELLKNGSFFL